MRSLCLVDSWEGLRDFLDSREKIAVLRLLVKGAPLTVAKICRMMHLDEAIVRDILDDLISAGFVEAERNNGTHFTYVNETTLAQALCELLRCL
jgi:predicted transcriptional regulator